MLSKDFGPWETGYGSCRRWRRAGGGERVLPERRQGERRCQGRLAEPSAGASASQTQIDVEVVEHTGTGLPVVPPRWVVERTFAWLLHYRRHRCDYAGLTANSAAMRQSRMMHLFLQRLA